MYFEQYTHMYYDFVKPNGDIDYVLLKDITSNIRFKRDVLQNIASFESYDMRDTDTPEIVSEKFYGSPFYHWVIMLANERYDYINDFPLSTYNLEKMIEEKYGTPGKYDVHHYECNGLIVDADYALDFDSIIDPQTTGNLVVNEVTNYDYEYSVNESKRRIRIIAPELLQTILTQFRRLL